MRCDWPTVCSLETSWENAVDLSSLSREESEMATLTERTARPERKPLPPPNSDFYQLAETLLPEELAVVKQVRAFMESNVAPIATKYWADDAFPFELLPAFKELNL